MRNVNQRNTLEQEKRYLEGIPYMPCFEDADISKGSFEFDVEVPPVKSVHRMSMEELISRTYTSLEDLEVLKEQLAYFRGLSGYQIYYRGHANGEYKLLSSLARNYRPNREKELRILEELKIYGRKRGWEKYCLSKFNENLFYLGVGRHWGLPCRLLDWTNSIDVALHFLAKEDLKKDGKLWILMVCRSVLEAYEQKEPFEECQKDFALLAMNSYLPDDELQKQPQGILRRQRQSGIFSITKETLLSKPLDEIIGTGNESMQLWGITIPAETKNLINAASCLDDDFLYLENLLDKDCESFVQYLAKNMSKQFIKSIQTPLDIR